MDLFDVRKQQLRVLKSNLRKADNTVVGQKYHFSTIRDYSSFKNQVPILPYSEIEKDIQDIKNKSTDVLWPGQINNFAVSSGTTGAGKHLPLSRERLKSDYRFMRRIVATYLKQKPTLSLAGPQLSLPGSIEYDHEKEIYLGEISGFLAQMIPFYLRPFQILPMKKLYTASWNEKFDYCLKKAIQKDLRVINAVPSWTLILFQKALELTGKKNISEIWPNLKLITGGGVSLRVYKESLRKLCGPMNPDFMEFYGASEGYFAFTPKTDQEEMTLVIDNGIFYEWTPYDKLSRVPFSSDIRPTWEIEPHIPYNIIITNNSGLWRYPMNDIVEFTDVNTLEMRVIGRASDMLDDYGEALYLQEAEKALCKTTQYFTTAIQQFFLAGKLDHEFDSPRHFWFINWKSEPVNIPSFSKLLDRNLCSINRHYAIRRESGALAEPEVYTINNNIMKKWLESQSNTSAQTKIPAILHDPVSIQSLLKIINME